MKSLKKTFNLELTEEADNNTYVKGQIACFSLRAQISFFPNHLHSVPRIVALITMGANTGMYMCLLKPLAHAAHQFLHSSSRILTFEPKFTV